jgi:tripartite-type tricarboxylate transporter receptor subunit TctC
MTIRQTIALCSALLAGLTTWSPAMGSENVEEFYKSKEIRLIIGEGPGGGYDTYARLLGNHMGKYIAGNPKIVAQNMPGAGTLRATNHVYAVANKDGTVLATAQRFVFIMPLLDLAGAQFDATKFSYVGSMSEDVGTCIAWREAGFQSIEDLKQRQFTIGTGGAGSQLTTFAAALSNTLGVKLKVIKGYQSGHDMNLAMERREVDGRCGVSYSSIKTLSPDWLEKDKIIVLLQLGIEPQPALPKVPVLVDLVKDERDKRALELLMTPTKIARPFFGPPAIPGDRLAALRKAFDQTMEDEAFRNDARSRGVEILPLGGQRMEELVKYLHAMPPAAVARAKELVAE